MNRGHEHNNIYLIEVMYMSQVKQTINGLNNANPLPEPMQPNYQLDPNKQTPVNFILWYEIFLSWKHIWKYI